MLALLGKHRAIVLSGHLHKYGVARPAARTRASFVQLAVSSIIRNDVEVPRHRARASRSTGPTWSTSRAAFSPPTLDQRRELLQAEAPFIERYAFADVPGYAS